MNSIPKLLVSVASVTLLYAQGQQPSDDPQSLAAVRAAVTRLNDQVLTLMKQVPALSDSTDKRFAGLQTALVPVGAVIDWYRPKPDTPVPSGFMICNNDVVNDADSPMNGARVPDLTDRFVMGVTPARLSETGGNAKIPDDGAHRPAIHFSGYAWGEINYDRGGGHQDQFQMQYAQDPVGNHNHGGENRPPYYGLIKLIRIK